MKLNRATPMLGIAAAVVLAIVAFQVLGSQNVGDAEPTPRVYAPEDLEIIIVSEANAPDDVTVNRTLTGVAALSEPMHPGGESVDTSAFVDAMSTELDYPGGRGYATWAALFETPEAAAAAYDFLVEEHESADGWDVEGTTPDPPLGAESRVWTGQQYDFASAQTLFWREGNLLLAVIGWLDWTDEGVREIADGMADRAR